MQDLLQLKEANDKKIYLQFPGGDNHSGPFKSEEEAEQKLDKLLSRAKSQGYDQEEIDNLKSLKIVTEAKVTGDSFRVSWTGYGRKAPKTVDASFFDDNGFSAKAKKAILALKVNDEWTDGGSTDSVTVRKIKAGKITESADSDKDAIILKIAKKYFDVDTLATRKSDAYDFYDIAVWSMKSALEAAYKAGAASKSLKEGKEYEDSSDFESAASKIGDAFKKLKKELGSEEIKDWMKQTDSNFGGNYRFATRIESINAAVKKSDKDFDALYSDLVKVSE